MCMRMHVATAKWVQTRNVGQKKQNRQHLAFSIRRISSDTKTPRESERIFPESRRPSPSKEENKGHKPVYDVACARWVCKADAHPPQKRRTKDTRLCMMCFAYARRICKADAHPPQKKRTKDTSRYMNTCANVRVYVHACGQGEMGLDTCIRRPMLL